MQNEPLVTGVKMTAQDQQFEDLLRRAEEYLKSRSPIKIKSELKKQNQAA